MPVRGGKKISDWPGFDSLWCCNYLIHDSSVDWLTYWAVVFYAFNFVCVLLLLIEANLLFRLRSTISGELGGAPFGYFSLVQITILQFCSSMLWLMRIRFGHPAYSCLCCSGTWFRLVTGYLTKERASRTFTWHLSIRPQRMRWKTRGLRLQLASTLLGPVERETPWIPLVRRSR